jgi:hypothetical protein
MRVMTDGVKWVVGGILAILVIASIVIRVLPHQAESESYIELNVRHRERLPKGATILVVNHNSHLDTLAVASIVPMRDLHRLRPVGARDYFCRNAFCEMLSRNLLGVIPLCTPCSGAPSTEYNSVLLCPPDSFTPRPHGRFPRLRRSSILPKS